MLGLKVVPADGQGWHGLRRFRKDNTGNYLRQLFVCSEETLGIITAAVLKLVPRPRGGAVASPGDIIVANSTGAVVASRNSAAAVLSKLKTE